MKLGNLIRLVNLLRLTYTVTPTDARSLTVVRHGQPPEAVVSVDVHAAVVQHDVRPKLIEVAGQPLC